MCVYMYIYIYIYVSLSPLYLSIYLSNPSLAEAMVVTAERAHKKDCYYYDDYYYCHIYIYIYIYIHIY